MDALLPDAEALFIAWVLAHPALASLHGGRVGPELTGSEPALRVSGTSRPTREWEDSPELYVECWGGSEEQARSATPPTTSRAQAKKLARTLVAAVPGMNGRHPRGAVRGAWVSLGPLGQHDQTSGRARYLVQVRWLSYPLEP